MRELESPRTYPEKDKEVFGGVGFSALLALVPQCCPHSTARGQQVHEAEALRDAVLQQVAGEGSRWEEVRDNVPSLRSLQPWATPAPPSREVTRRAVPGTWVPGPRLPSLAGEVTRKRGTGTVCRGSRRVVWGLEREAVRRARVEGVTERRKVQARETGSAMGFVGI